MNPHYRPTSTVEHPEARNRSETQLQGPWLVLARIAWCVVLLLVVGIVIAGIPPYFAYLHTLTSGGVVDLGHVQLTHDGVHALHALGLSIDFFAVFTIVLNTLFVFGFVLIGAVLFWRKADDRLALYTSFALVAFPIGFLFSLTTTLPPAWSFPVQCIAFLGGTSFDIFCYLFPSGRFVPPWTRWLIIGWVIYEGSEHFFPSSPFNPHARFPALSFGLFFALLASVVAVQIYRYRRVSTPLERQQTKWVVFGFTLGILGLIGTILLSLLFPVFFQPGTLAYFVLYPVFLLSPLCIPISIKG